LLWEALRVFGEPIFLLGSESSFARIPTNIRVWRIEVQTPGFNQRQQTWETALGPAASEYEPARLADTFRFGGQRIHQTIDMARSLIAVRKPTQREPDIQDLLDAGRALTSPQVGRFALRVEPRYGWNDIVLPPEKAQKLHHIASWIKYRRTVHRDWGFGQKLSRGKGLNVLFTGPSGTGKTMAAEVLAGELSLDLYQIDLSSVVSKYIGETEKNLSAIFREAEQTQTLLFFDEADALFGKRTEVKDAHDRYANIEVNYLLQRVEQYEGVVILATNLQQNLDDAFLRRMQEVLEFPFPNAELRERIWRGHFPKGAPKSIDIDFEFLAQSFKWPGGNIKNIVLSAAFLAAQESKPISMSHLIKATRAEYQKEGKLAVKTDFGRYYDLIARSA
jgi:SpoVK/Ycf46/Vps4 family AAA+-type ATPase